MAEEIIDDDPILKKLNGTKQKPSVDAAPDDDPILQKLNAGKKKEPTVSVPNSESGSTTQTQETSTEPVKPVGEPSSKPSEKSGIEGTKLTEADVQKFKKSTDENVGKTSEQRVAESRIKAEEDAATKALIAGEKYISPDRQSELSDPVTRPLKSLWKTVHSGVTDQLPKEYYVQRLRMSKGNFGDLFDKRSNINAFADQIPKEISRDEYSKWNNSQPTNVRDLSDDEKARMFITEKLGAAKYQEMVDRFKIENTDQRLGFEKEIQQQNEDAVDKLDGVTQDLREVNSATDFLSFAGNMIGQAVYRMPISIATGTTGSIVAESAAVYDRQLDLIAKDKNISREEVIKQGLDKPAEGQAIATMLGTLDAVSAGTVLGLFKKAVTKEITETAAKKFAKNFIAAAVPEAVTEGIQGEGEEFAAAKGAGVDYNFDAWRLATSTIGGALGGGVIGVSTPSPAQTAKAVTDTATETVKEETKDVNPNDTESVDRSAEAIQAKVEENEKPVSKENDITDTTLKSEEVISSEPTQPEVKNQETASIEKTPIESEVSNFTPAEVINKGYNSIKEKVGEKKAQKYFEQVDKLIDPNKNQVVEYRQNGVVTKEGDKYTLHPLADMELKNWRLSERPIDVTDQFKSQDNAPKKSDESLGFQSEPEKGYVRVYHSGSKGDGQSGRWVSTDKKYAENYRSDKPLFYFDILKSDPRLKSEYAEQSVEKGFTKNFELTPEESKNLQEIPRQSQIKPSIPETKQEPQKRKFTKRVLEDPTISNEVKQGISDEGRNYIPRSLTQVTAKEADTIVTNLGVDKAMKQYLAPDTEMSGDVETAVGISLAKKLNEAKRIDDAVKVIEKLAIRGTELGQQVNAYKLLTLLSPEGIIHSVQKSKTKQRKIFREQNEWRADKLEKEIGQENQKNVEKALKSVRQKVEGAVRKGSIQKAIDFLDTLKIDTKGKALSTVDFGLTPALWNALISTVQAGLKAGLTVSQAIQKAVDKAKKESKDFDAKGATQHLDEKLKDFRVTLDPKRALQEELKQQQLKIEDIVRKHYTEVAGIKQSLIDKLVKDAGIPKEQAEEIQKNLADEFDKLSRSARERIIKKYLPKENKKSGVTSKVRADVTKELLDAQNLGALGKKEYLDIISEKLGAPKLTTEQAQKLYDLGEKIQAAKGPMQQNRAAQDALNYIEGLKGWTWKDAVQAIWYANILSGPSTWLITNPFANVTQFLAEGLLSTAQNPRQAGFILSTAAKGFLRGALASADVLKTGYNPFKGEDFKTESKPLLERIKFKGGKFNPTNYLKYVTRAIKAGDILFYHPLQELRTADLAIKEAKKNGHKIPTKEDLNAVYQQYLKPDFEAAMAQAESEGLTGRQQKLRAYEVLEEKRPELVVKDANDFAATATFNTKPVGVLGQLANVLNTARTHLPAINYIIPFVNTILNVANEYMNYNPIFGYLRVATGSYGFNPESKTYKKLSQEERARIAMKATAGTLAMAAVFLMDDPDDEDNWFEITANGYGDQQKNYELERSGWRPWSIRIGDKWMSYKNTPLAFVFAPVGYLKDAQRYTKDSDAGEKAAIMALGSFKFLMEQSTLSSLSDFFSIFGSDDISRYESAFKKGQKLAENVGKSVIIPNAVTQTSRAVQDIADLPMKKANNFVDNIIRDLPVLRDNLNNMYDAFGDPVVPKQLEKLTPFNVSDVDKDDTVLFKFLKENQATIGRPSKNTLKPNGQGMTEEEYDKFALLAGQMTKKALEEELSNLQQLETEQQVRDAISDIKTNARKQARQTLFGFDGF